MNKDMSPRLLLLLAVIIWGSTFVATKVVVPFVSPAELIGLRLLIGMPIIAAVAIAKRVRFRFNRREQLNILLSSTIICAHFLVQITGLKYTSATNTGWLIAVSPLILAILSATLLHEKVGKREIVGIAVATTGVVLLVSKGDLTHLHWLENVGDWLVLASAFTWAIYTVSIRDVTRSHDPVAVTLAVLLPTAIGLFCYMIWASNWSYYLQLPTSALLALIYLGIFGTALGHWFWQEGLAKVGATKAGIFLYLEPISTTLLAVSFLGEGFGAASGIGAAFILGGVYWAEKRTSNSESEK